MIRVSVTGSFDKFLNSLTFPFMSTEKILEKYGKIGVERLSAATPVDTGKTASSWYYKVAQPSKNKATLTFYNSNSNQGVPIALMIQYGHGTPTGGYVPGRDYINPALKPIFDDISKRIVSEVSKI